jgi:ABC-type transport system involved in cytochrome c biogenesis permease subunit
MIIFRLHLFISVIFLLIAFLIHKFASYEISRLVVIALAVILLFYSFTKSIRGLCLIEKIKKIISLFFLYGIGIFSIIVFLNEYPKFSLIVLFVLASLMALIIEIDISRHECK